MLITKYVDTGPESPAQGKPSGEAQSAPSEEFAIDDKLMEKLLAKGLTNDVYAFASDFMKLKQEYATMSDFERKSGKGRLIATQLNFQFDKVNEMARNAKEFDLTNIQIKKNEGENAFAVIDENNLLVQRKTDKGMEYTSISMEDYNKSKNNSDFKWQAMRNKDVMHARQNDKNFVNNQMFIQYAKNTKGFGLVKKEILNNVSMISASQVTKENGDNTVSNKNNHQQVSDYINAVYKNLSQESRNQLMAQAAVEGDSDTPLYIQVQKQITDVLRPKLYSTTSDLYDEGRAKAKADSGTGSSDKTKEMGAYSQMLNNSPNAKDTLKVKVASGAFFEASAYSAPIDVKDKATSVRLGTAGEMMNTESVFLAGIPMPGDVLDNIMYADSKLYKANLPVKKDESHEAGSSGRTVVDYQLIDIAGSETNRINNSNLSVAEKQQAYIDVVNKTPGLVPKYDANNPNLIIGFDYRNKKTFAVADVYINADYKVNDESLQDLSPGDSAKWNIFAENNTIKSQFQNASIISKNDKDDIDFIKTTMMVEIYDNAASTMSDTKTYVGENNLTPGGRAASANYGHQISQTPSLSNNTFGSGKIPQ